MFIFKERPVCLTSHLTGILSHIKSLQRSSIKHEVLVILLISPLPKKVLQSSYNHVSRLPAMSIFSPAVWLFWLWALRSWLATQPMSSCLCSQTILCKMPGTVMSTSELLLVMCPQPRNPFFLLFAQSNPNHVVWPSWSPTFIKKSFSCDCPSSHHPYLPPPNHLLRTLTALSLKEMILPLFTPYQKTEAYCLVWVVLFPQLTRKLLEGKGLLYDFCIPSVLLLMF